MHRRRDGVGGEDGVGEFEEGVGSAVEALVERVAEGVKSVVGFHNAPIMHSPTAFRILYMPAQLKRKLSCCPKSMYPSCTAYWTDILLVLRSSK